MRGFKPSAAMVVALLALIVSLAGSAFAASYVITKSSQIKNGVITGSDIKDSSLTATDVKNNSLLANDFKAGQLPAGQQGQQGPQGPQGSQGPKGATGARGPSDLYTDFSEADTATTGMGDAWFDVLASVKPADGDYVAYANAIVENTTPDTVELQCMIGGTSLDVEFADTTEVVLAAGARDNIALQGPTEFPTSPYAQGLLFMCSSPPTPASGAIAYRDIDLGALQVGTWH